MTFRGYGCVAVAAFLLLLTVCPVPAAVTGLSSAAPVVAAGVPNILQEKPKMQYTWKDFQKEGEKSAINDNWEEALSYYNKAEEVLIASDSGRSGETDTQLSELEAKKGLAYAALPGHEADEAAAYKKSEELRESGKKKMGLNPGCLIVTATFGSPLASEVQLVRNFRDDSIAKSYTGSRFMPGFNAWYYSFSPQVSMYIREHPVVKPVMQVLITPVLDIVLLAQTCWNLLSFSPELATITAIIVGSSLYGLVYVFPTVMACVWVARRRGWKGTGSRNIWPAAAAWGILLLLIVTGAAFSFDLLTTIASGLFVLATIIFIVAALSVWLSKYIGQNALAAGQ